MQVSFIWRGLIDSGGNEVLREGEGKFQAMILELNEKSSLCPLYFSLQKEEKQMLEKRTNIFDAGKRSWALIGDLNARHVAWYTKGSERGKALWTFADKQKAYSPPPTTLHTTTRGVMGLATQNC